jgi:hypothetical protein
MQNQIQYSEESQKQNTQDLGDILSNLPIDQSLPSHTELKLVDHLFKKKKTFFEKILAHAKDILIIGVLFILFSIPQLDDIIKKFITISNKSPYILLGIKTLLFMLTYFIVKNWYLSRKK